MASQNQVRKYLAYWFQLGKKVLIHNGSETLLPKSVIAGDRYSKEFEDCWQKIISSEAGDCYLEGTRETIAELLTPAWEIDPCARCAMPIPLRHQGMPPDCCPCFDLPSWPDNEIPKPRSPVSNQAQLSDIRNRLFNKAASGE
ncbi:MULTISPECIES: hypothetical protein [Kamptonema]|uniref:hypothetical protein n=1 Tax=Kamptonema TaxID=1501433 RepID=UPI0001DAD388|nr:MULTISPECIES: hypothetical protein [Kamptonema]CBN57131.1 conserved hypothetical protein [Kamptonema sp. PCC 6506]